MRWQALLAVSVLFLPIGLGQPQHVEADSEPVDDALYGSCPEAWAERCALWAVDNEALGVGDERISSSPLLASDGDTTFVVWRHFAQSSGDALRVGAVSSSGEVLWAVDVDDPNATSSAIAPVTIEVQGGDLFVVARSNHLGSGAGAFVARLDGGSGAILWDTFLQGPNNSYMFPASAVVSDSHIHVALQTSPPQVAVLDLATGEAAWDVALGEGARAAPTLAWDVERDQLLVAHVAVLDSGEQELLVSAMAADGTPLWSESTATSIGWYIRAAALDATRGLWALQFNKEVLQVSAVNGSVLWIATPDLDATFLVNIMPVRDGWAISGHAGGRAFAALMDRDGETTWSYVGPFYSAGYSMGVLPGDKVALAGAGRNSTGAYVPWIVAVDAGVVAWEFFETSDRFSIFQAAAANANGLAVAATSWQPATATTPTRYELHAFSFDAAGPVEQHTAAVHCLVKTNGNLNAQCSGEVAGEGFQQSLP